MVTPDFGDDPLDVLAMQRTDDRLAAIAAGILAARAAKYAQAIGLCGEMLADELDFALVHGRKEQRFWALIESIDNDDLEARRLALEIL